MSNYVTIDGLKYDLTGKREYERDLKKSQSVEVGLTGKTLSQSFSVTDERFQVRLYVYRTEGRSGYGSLSDLEASYDDDYVTFIDQLGNSQDIFFEGSLKIPYGNNLLSDELPIVVPVNMRKRQVV
jgi:hypothetical protein